MMKLWLVAVVLLFLPFNLAEAEEGLLKKAPPPTQAATAAATQLVNDVYKGDLAAAKTSQQRQALARQLLKAAREEKDFAGRYVLLDMAGGMAAKAGDLGTAFAAIDACDNDVEIDALKMKTEAAGVAAKAKLPAPEAKTALDNISAVLRASLAADRFDLAGQLVDAKQQIARSSSDSAMVKEATLDVQTVKDTEASFQKAKAAILILAAKPDDPDANLALGKYRCFVKSDWKNGLPMLALGSDATLKGLAERERAGVSAVEDQVKVGDAWWDIAEKMVGMAKNIVQEHAVSWYKEAIPSVAKGLTRSKLEKRLAESLQNQTSAPASTSAIINNKNRDEFVGRWTADAVGWGVILNADGTVNVPDSDRRGTWTSNKERTAIDIKWNNGNTGTIKKIGDGWVKTSLSKGQIINVTEVSPPKPSGPLESVAPQKDAVILDVSQSEVWRGQLYALADIGGADGLGEVFVNGKSVLRCDRTKKTATAAEVVLRKGDWITAKLSADGENHCIRLAFITKDGRLAAAFKAGDYVEISGRDVATLPSTVGQTGTVEAVRSHGDNVGRWSKLKLPDSVNPDYVWGRDPKQCHIGVRIEARMFSPPSP